MVINLMRKTKIIHSFYVDNLKVYGTNNHQGGCLGQTNVPRLPSSIGVKVSTKGIQFINSSIIQELKPEATCTFL